MSVRALKAANIRWFDGYITREDRERLHGHKGAVVWLTGLSGSGKSTIAQRLERILHEKGCSTYVFDGDNVRHGLCSDLGFSPEERVENIRRIGEMVKLFLDGGIIALTAFISPYRKDREGIKELVGKERFFEVYVECPVAICAERDPKGMYAKAKAGLIKEFTGISAPYEPPEQANIVISSHRMSADEGATRIYRVLRRKGIV